MKKIVISVFSFAFCLLSGCDELIEPKDIMLLVKDNIPPVVFLETPSNNQPVGMSVAYLGSVKDVGRGVFRVYILIDNGEWETVFQYGDLWSKNVDFGMAYGPHTVYLQAMDKASNFSLILTNTIYRAAIASVNITSPLHNILTNTSNITLHITCAIDDPYIITNVAVRINNGPLQYAAMTNGGWTNWRADVVFPEGSNTYTVIAYPNQPIASSTSVRKLTVDMTPPVFVSVNYANLQFNNASSYPLELVFSDSVSGISNVYLSLNGGAFVPISYSAPYWNYLANDVKCTAHVWSYYAVDKLGHISLTNKTVIVRKNVGIQKFVAYDGYSNQNLGSGGNNSKKVALSDDGNSFIVTSEFVPFIGIYYFHFNGSIWTTNKFNYVLANPAFFGNSIAISSNGSSFIVGCRYETNTASVNTGSVFFNTWNGSSWGFEKLFPHDGNGGEGCGISVDFTPDGNTIVAGAFEESDPAASQGAVYRFHWNGSSWESLKFIAQDGDLHDYLGYCVAVSADGNTILAGSAGYGSEDKNKVYRFHFDGIKWVTNGFQGASDDFGQQFSLSDDGNKLAVGILGTVYFYRFNGSTWETNVFSEFSGTVNFGYTIAISGDGNTLVVGDSADWTGVVYRYHWNGSEWATTNKIIVYNAFPSIGIGSCVSVSYDGKTIAATAPADDEKAVNAGAVYLIKSGEW